MCSAQAVRDACAPGACGMKTGCREKGGRNPAPRIHGARRLWTAAGCLARRGRGGLRERNHASAPALSGAADGQVADAGQRIGGRQGAADLAEACEFTLRSRTTTALLHGVKFFVPRWLTPLCGARRARRARDRGRGGLFRHAPNPRVRDITRPGSARGPGHEAIGVLRETSGSRSLVARRITAAAERMPMSTGAFSGKQNSLGAALDRSRSIGT